LSFARVNRDVQRKWIGSWVDYWTLAIRIEFAKFHAHDVNKPVNILGMRVYSFSLDTLSLLMNEIFVRREYGFTPDGDAPLILDCGSNIGISILFFKKLFPRARVIGFEPDKNAFELLSRNVAENRLSDVSLYNVAVSSMTGEVPFFSNSQKPGSLVMSLIERKAGETRQVPCIALSSFVQGPVDLLKMDIEGAEMDVMRELAASEALKNVRAIVMEYHLHIRTEDALSEMLRLLEDHSFGYDLGAVLPAQPGKFQDILLRIYRKGISSSA
jgi:FkbM family methyltransferase